MQDTKPTSPLHAFVAAAKARGAGDEFLTALLARHGWPANDIYAELAAHWEQTTGIAVPRRGNGAESSREAFLYLLSFLALAIWASALGTVLFQLVNVWIPDPVASGYIPYVRTTITWSLAALAVSFPLYLLVVRVQVREAHANPERLQTGVRKWLTYLALLITAGTVIGDLIGFVGYFLLGELTARFALKSIIVLLICGGIFAYYMASLPGGGKVWSLFGRSQHRLFAWVSMAVVAAVFIAGIAVAGNPGDQRRLQADTRRVQDLRRIASAVEQWRAASRVQAKAATNRANDGEDPGLPESLEALAQRQRIERIQDPETSKPYRYEVVGPVTYQLCAGFAAATPEIGEGYRPESRFWDHPQGEHCFVLDATKPVAW